MVCESCEEKGNEGQRASRIHVIGPENEATRTASTVSEQQWTTRHERVHGNIRKRIPQVRFSLHAGH